MARLGLEREVVDVKVLERTAARFREAKIVLPTFAELAEPQTIPETTRVRLADVGPDEAHPLNLFRVHWLNGPDRMRQAPLPDHLVLPQALTGVPAKIIVALGDRFPMIRAHKVLAAYGCLVPRIVTGQFDPTAHRAVWPSTGNYCRGGVAISRILGCHGVAVLPEGMSEERFRWLEHWVQKPGDIVRTPGSESNVKEIYDACAALDRVPGNVIFNQFSEFANHLVHHHVTGRALDRVLAAAREDHAGLRLAAFVSATGSAGTIAAGDYLKDRHGARIVAVEALECPTLLENGFGEHNIQGIGDKHVPLIHNVMNSDFVVGVSDRLTDRLLVLMNTEEGRRYLRVRAGLAPELVDALSSLGLSSICNVLAAIKVARYLKLGADDAIMTVATDGAAMYLSEIPKAIRKHFRGEFDAVSAGETFARDLMGQGIEATLELGQRERTRIFNLGYYTWVEQQGVSFADFEARREQTFWRGLRDLVPVWDRLIQELNERARA